MKLFGWDDWNQEEQMERYRLVFQQQFKKKVLDKKLEQKFSELHTLALEKPKMLVEFDENGKLVLKENPIAFFANPENTSNCNTYFEKTIHCFNAIQELIVLKETISHDPLLDYLKEIMPGRTRAMGATAAIVREMQEQGLLPQTAVFIAGANHLKLDNQYKDVPEMSLEKFYEEIEKHPSIVLSAKK